jgi:hypothetical protein
MEIEERMDLIEEAYRALLAKHLALSHVCAGMLPLISISTGDIQRSLLHAYDGLNSNMDKLGMDEHMQQSAREVIDAFSKTILEVAHTRAGQKSP